MTVCPCRPSAQVEAPFYEEWWFLLVMALSSLIVVLLVVFALVLHGQNRKYKNCSTGGLPPPHPRFPKGELRFSLPHLCRPRHVPSHSVEWLQPTSFRRQQVQGSGPFEPFGFRTCFLICTVAQMH